MQRACPNKHTLLFKISILLKFLSRLLHSCLCVILKSHLLISPLEVIQGFIFQLLPFHLFLHWSHARLFIFLLPSFSELTSHCLFNSWTVSWLYHKSTWQKLPSTAIVTQITDSCPNPGFEVPLHKTLNNWGGVGRKERRGRVREHSVTFWLLYPCKKHEQLLNASSVEVDQTCVVPFQPVVREGRYILCTELARIVLSMPGNLIPHLNFKLSN